MSNIFFGIPEGVVEGQCFKNRMALVEARVHRSHQGRIDGNEKEGTAAIILSGKYPDDDFGDKIIYSGEGGNDNGKQISDQSLESFGNFGLLISKGEKLPVRVIRGYKHRSRYSPKQGYQFAGIYYVTRIWEETDENGFRLCRFELIKENQIKDILP